MIYRDLEKIYQKYNKGDHTHNISDKYQLTLVVSARARQISESKSLSAMLGGSEMYITRALEEVEDSKLEFQFSEQPIKVPENDHVVVES